MWLNHIKQFFKGFEIIFPYYTKRAGSQFNRNNVLRHEDEEY